MLRKDPFITGEYYHLYNRGIDKRVIYKSKFDFTRFIVLLAAANSKEPIRLDNLRHQQYKTYEEILQMEREHPLVSIGAWCLMSNHFHILVRQEINGGITQFMKKLGTGYSMYFNIKHERQGALFGGPFKSKLVDADDNYLRHLFGYIHLNPLDIMFPGWAENTDKPVRQMRDFLESYRYSSYLDYTGKERAEGMILNKEAFPDYFLEIHRMKDFVENYFIPIR